MDVAAAILSVEKASSVCPCARGHARDAYCRACNEGVDVYDFCSANLVPPGCHKVLKRHIHTALSLASSAPDTGPPDYPVLGATPHNDSLFNDLSPIWREAMAIEE